MERGTRRRENLVGRLGGLRVEVYDQLPPLTILKLTSSQHRRPRFDPLLLLHLANGAEENDDLPGTLVLELGVPESSVNSSWWAAFSLIVYVQVSSNNDEPLSRLILILKRDDQTHILSLAGHAALRHTPFQLGTQGLKVEVDGTRSLRGPPARAIQHNQAMEFTRPARLDRLMIWD